MKCAKEVDPSDEDVQAVARRMIELMFEHNGVGLAAPQVGLSWRIFVTRDPEDEHAAHAWMNPSIEIMHGDIGSDEEGCLSLPEIRGEIKRPAAIRITGYDADGKCKTEESDEFISRIWQHENDHLDGILIIDKMSVMDRLVNRKLIRDLERQQQ
jgi:peptide deformylase